ncbi:MAG: UDP-N-acetylmuramoyl-L-alanyl-D-glutamate--2,6-diaminopimelate ligase [Balneolaceae bacterium]
MHNRQTSTYNTGNRITADELIALCNPISVNGTLPGRIGALCTDSRDVQEGDLFIAVRGVTYDGHDYIEEAAGRGAFVIIAMTEPVQHKNKPAWVQVQNTRRLLGPLAQAVYGDPAQKLKLIGVTGTNGKTTTATLIWQILNSAGYGPSLLSTVIRQVGGESLPSRLTTPDPIELASDMRRAVDAGSDVLVMEVSSHALDQERVSGVHFETALFMNLSHDHLDYHGSMESYLQAKKVLFDTLDQDATAIIYADDPVSTQMTADCTARVNRFGFSTESAVDTKCELIQSDANGMEIRVGDHVVRTPLVGRFNASNVAAASLACRTVGLGWDQIVEGVLHATGAPGRMERVVPTMAEGKHPTVIVDYAHTPDALYNVARTLYELKRKEDTLTLVFGCGGDRDRAKRPEMAKAAEKWADRIVVTSDNPRSESPESIIGDIMNGFNPDTKVRVEPDRKVAIEEAILQSDGRGVILIAGKGHETWQDVGGKRYPFDDRLVARQALEGRIEAKNRNGGV